MSRVAGFEVQVPNAIILDQTCVFSNVAALEGCKLVSKSLSIENVGFKGLRICDWS